MVEAPRINPKFNSEIIKNRIIENSIPITETGCWIWMGGVGKSGYGILSINNKSKSVHRIAYEAFVGQIPDGLLVCHKCDIKVCLNPRHLFLGTQKDNIQDAVKKGHHFEKERTHCPYEHPYSKENTYIVKKYYRECKICKRKKSNERYWRIKYESLGMVR